MPFRTILVVFVLRPEYCESEVKDLKLNISESNLIIDVPTSIPNHSIIDLSPRWSKPVSWSIRGQRYPCPAKCLWDTREGSRAAAPKGTMSYRTQGRTFHPSIHLSGYPFVHLLVHLSIHLEGRREGS